jgi:hypothetical protein
MGAMNEPYTMKLSLLVTLVTISYAHLGVVWPSQDWCSEWEFEATLYTETLNLREKSSSYIWVNRVTLLMLFCMITNLGLSQPSGEDKDCGYLKQNAEENIQT